MRPSDRYRQIYTYTDMYLCALDVNVYIISGAYAPDNIVKHCSAGLCCTCVYSIYMYYRPASDEWELLRGLRHKPCAVELSECGETVTETERGRRRRGRDGGWSQLILHPAREETQVNAEQCEEHSAEKQFGYDYKGLILLYIPAALVAESRQKNFQCQF